ncbi:hypothetical protein N0V88_007947 [Collariella sp. IMI 366227]|nr:hypothetical protein N0V88_007947 [Collariella sp. IMI 366227]
MAVLTLSPQSRPIWPPRLCQRGGSGNLLLTRPLKTRKFGSLEIFEEAKVLELNAQVRDVDTNTLQLSKGLLDKILSKTVIVVPCKDEDLAIIRGVISAVPASCLVLLVSNSKRGHDGQYKQELEIAKAFSSNGKRVLYIHQKDARAASAFQASGLPEVLNHAGGSIRNGKGEGMLLGIAVAAAFCPDQHYIGFVDADNLNPGSVTEYCAAFAAGFAMSAMSASPEAEHSMVRLKWASKPKERSNGRFEFVTEGRCSRIVNSWLNKLFAPGFTDTPFITTGNAGEHAMTMGLAVKLRMAAGYAIEPFHFVDMLARGHLVTPEGTQAHARLCPNTLPSLDKPVRVVQIRTLNPHYHRASDDEHIRRMWAAGLGSIYHGLAPYRSVAGSDECALLKLSRDMHDFAATHDGLDQSSGELPRPRVYPALENMDLQVFREVLGPSLGFGSVRSAGLETWSY